MSKKKNISLIHFNSIQNVSMRTRLKNANGNEN